MSPSPLCSHLATESTDHTAMLWNTDGSLLKKFEGHLDCLARIGFHPSGKYLGTTRFDKTWRLKYRFWCGAEKPCQTGSWNHLFIQWLSCRYFKPVKTLSAHEAKVTSLNIPNLDKQVVGADAKTPRGLEKAEINKIFLTLSSRREEEGETPFPFSRDQ
ncbi:hypothetical protein OIU77_017964 [Salix suchowensis]|uniref:Uncharacterized protein n=1 Tax=Salix suchowensis TaxID=1278906 RepID=A0ABQ8ZQR5_9ROSI|nr:hypothetical protein OIU77_017964 [Salix suchowensis]